MLMLALLLVASRPIRLFLLLVERLRVQKVIHRAHITVRYGMLVMVTCGTGIDHLIFLLVIADFDLLNVTTTRVAAVRGIIEREAELVWFSVSKDGSSAAWDLTVRAVVLAATEQITAVV